VASFAVEDIRVDTAIADRSQAAGYSRRCFLFLREDANLKMSDGVLVRMSRGGQAAPVSSVIDSYRESTKNLSEVRKHTDDLLVYDNTAHRRGYPRSGALRRGRVEQSRTDDTGLGC